MAQSEGLLEESRQSLDRKAKVGKDFGAMETTGAKLTRLSLGTFMWALVASFVALMIVMPTGHSLTLLKAWKTMMYSPDYGYDGIFGLLWCSPILLLVFSGSVYLYLYPRSSRRSKKKAPRAGIGAHPVIVGGLFGVVSMAELLCIVAFTLIVTWILTVLLLHGFSSASEKHPSPTNELWVRPMKTVAVRLGFVGQLCLGLLFLPVARGSVLLRLLDIPLEHAAKYHVWLGHFTMSIFSLHGLGFIVGWTAEGRLIEKLLSWKVRGIANLPGVIALLAGLCMWATSFQFTRIRAFELFFYTHQLYIIFIIFMAMHVGDFFFGMAFAGIFLFTFDRFLRFLQSRREVGVLSAKVLPCGTLELVLPKPSNLRYNALSFVFLNIPVLGRLEWHPFSVSSSPKDGPDSIKFLIKPLGTWTKQLSQTVREAASTKCPLSLKAAVEGPYGHETSYFLDYEALLLVAGGIGVSPFVAILRDILHRHRENEVHLPRDVTLVWAVKRHEELAVLDSLCPVSIFPEYASRLSLTVKAFVTQEVEEDVDALEEGPSQSDVVTNLPSTKYNPAAMQQPISSIVGSGDILWVGAAIAASLFGYLGVTKLIGKVYLFVVDHEYSELGMPWWIRGAGLYIGILVGVWFFGGSVILMWYLWGTKPAKKPSTESEPLLENSEQCVAGDIPVEKLVQRSNTVYGSRPNLQEVFDSCAKRSSGSNVGVLVCGPEGLQTSVAFECRAFNTAHENQNKVAFSYHSVSFDL